MTHEAHSPHHNTVSASGQACRPLGRGSRRRALPTTRLGSHHPHPHLGRRSMGGDTLHRVLGWHVALVTPPLRVASTAQPAIRDGDARYTAARWLALPTALHGPP